MAFAKMPRKCISNKIFYYICATKLTKNKAKMNFRLLNMAVAVLFTALTVSCSKEVITEDEPSQEPNSTLNIRTRVGEETAGGTAAEVSYQVNIYVFGTDGKCCKYVQIGEGESEISIELLEGTYEVYAIAGADASSYALPAQATATKKSLVALTGEAHSDLMVAGNVVVLADGGENTLTLALQRKVMLVQSIVINNVPSSVKAVSVTIAPLYENLCVDGSYGEAQGPQEISLANDGGTKTWRSSGSEYLLPPSAANATITVNMTDGTGQLSSYSYTSAEELQANYKINIEGTYTEPLGVQLSGTIIGAEWDGERNISFDFDESGSTVTPGGGDTTGGDDQPDVSTEAPQPGTFYQDKYYVLKSETDGGVTEVTLMTTDETTVLSGTVADQEAVRSAVDGAIAEMTSASGIAGWRLPTQEEMEYVLANFKAIQDKMLDNSFTRLSAANAFYFLTADDGRISSYTFNGDGWLSDTLDEETKLRAFTTVTFR